MQSVISIVGRHMVVWLSIELFEASLLLLSCNFTSKHVHNDDGALMCRAVASTSPDDSPRQADLPYAMSGWDCDQQVSAADWMLLFRQWDLSSQKVNLDSNHDDDDFYVGCRAVASTSPDDSPRQADLPYPMSGWDWDQQVSAADWMLLFRQWDLSSQKVNLDSNHDDDDFYVGCRAVASTSPDDSPRQADLPYPMSGWDWDQQDSAADWMTVPTGKAGLGLQVRLFQPALSCQCVHCRPQASSLILKCFFIAQVIAQYLVQ